MRKFVTYLFLLALTIMSLPAYSLSVWDGTADIWTEGTGTEEDPYQIATAQQFAFIAEMVNGGVTTYADMHFLLMDDIDLNNLEWSPIGDDIHVFQASFNGNGHKVINAVVTSNRNYNGIFGNMNGYIRNLEVAGSISNGTYSGGIVAHSAGEITNCSFSGSVIGRSFSGGISGYASAAISRCINDGSIFCNSFGKIYLGGIVGYSSASINSCGNFGTLRVEYDNGTTQDVDCYAGGIVGASETTNIDACFNKGDVYVSITSTTDAATISATSCGIIGKSLASSLVINYCYNIGDITAKTQYTT